MIGMVQEGVETLHSLAETGVLETAVVVLEAAAIRLRLTDVVLAVAAEVRPAVPFAIVVTVRIVIDATEMDTAADIETIRPLVGEALPHRAGVAIIAEITDLRQVEDIMMIVLMVETVLAEGTLDHLLEGTVMALVEDPLEAVAATAVGVRMKEFQASRFWCEMFRRPSRPKIFKGRSDASVKFGMFIFLVIIILSSPKGSRSSNTQQLSKRKKRAAKWTGFLLRVVN